MSELQIEQKITFENQVFKPLRIPVKKQDGLNPVISLFIEENGNSLLVVKNHKDVVMKIGGDNLALIPML